MGEGMKRAKAAAKATRKPYTLADAMESVAKSLREYGYPDVTAAMVREIYDAYETGKRFPDLPHSVIGGFAQSQFDEVATALKMLAR